jgi:hypothetical protein
MLVEIFNCSFQRRNATNRVFQDMMNMVLPKDLTDRMTVHITFDDQQQLLSCVERGRTLSFYDVTLSSYHTISEDQQNIAFAVIGIRQYALKERQLLPNTDTKFRWKGEVIDTETLNLYDNPILIDIIGRSTLLCRDYSSSLQDVA